MKLISGKYAKKIKLSLGILVGLIILLVASIVVVHKVYDDNLKPVGLSQHGQTVTIPLGYSAHQIAVALKDAGVIRQAWAFEWYIRNNDLRDKLQAGTYVIRPNQSVPEIASIITNGQVAK